MATVEPERCEIWRVDFSPGKDSEQTGRRPALILQTDPANRNPRYPNTIIAAVSSRGRDVPSHVIVEPSAANGLTSTSFIKCEQILTISKNRLEARLGRLDPDDIERVATALRLALEL